MTFYKICRFLVWIYYHLIYKIEVVGLEKIPGDDGALICPNHYHWGDPLLIAICFKRNIRFMAKYELFQKPLLRWLLINLGVFPVKRGEADLSAIKNTIKILRDKQLVGLFPEGTRIKGGQLGRANAGVAVFSIKTEKPAIPVLISGSYRWFSKLKIKIGDPVELIQYRKDKMTNEDYLELSQVIMEKIAELKKED